MNDAIPGLSGYINRRDPWLNSLVLAYVAIGYGAGVYGLTAPGQWLNVVGVGLVIHTLMCAAYLVHDLIHGNIFRSSTANEAVGRVLLFLTGSCYCRYRDLARNHLAHHKNRADFSPFSIAAFLRSLPRPVTQLIVVLEWCYFPALNFILRWLAALSPFLGDRRRGERLRNGLLLLVRGSLFIALALISPKAIGLYFIAYISFINVLRFMDCFQHTYPVFQLGQEIPRFSLAHEEANTFSNLLSPRWKWLNLLFLNFGYHNAHHRVVRCPWYLLPKLDAELYPRDYRQYLTLAQLIGNYHRFRIYRLFNGQGEVSDSPNGVEISRFAGGVGVSFLILRDPLDWLEVPVITSLGEAS